MIIALSGGVTSAPRIVLVRHGRSAHVHRGFVDLAGFHRWRDTYEAAGVDEREEPPKELKALASASGIVVASRAPRAVAHARLLDPDRDVTTSELLHELELAPPAIRGIRMPLIGWAIAIGMRRHVSDVEIRRARDARNGWRRSRAGRMRHWSAWSLSRER